MVKAPLLLLVLALAAAHLPAEQYAVTEDGLEVVLADDGTWKYSDEGRALAHQIEEHYWRGLLLDTGKALFWLAVFYGGYRAWRRRKERG